MATTGSSVGKMAAPNNDTKTSPPDSSMDHDLDLKAQAEASEYVESGVSPDDVEFKKKEKALVRKLDLYIAPVMMMLMLISYLDRGNIGFAATQGMADDIGLKGNQLNVRVGAEPSLRSC